MNKRLLFVPFLALLVPAGSTGAVLEAVETCGPPVPESKGAEPEPEPVADLEATLQALHAVYADLPSFIDVYYRPDQDVAFRPMFVAEVPDEARARSTPVPVAFDTIDAAPVPLGPGPAPDANDVLCPGVRPGVLMGVPSGCTFNFIFTASGNTYIGTAGHCVEAGREVCALNVCPLGITVFSRNGGVGQDFALVRVYPQHLGLVNPEMCDWAGPKGVFNGASIFGRTLFSTGHGGVAFLLPPRPKGGPGVGIGATSFSWYGNGIPGDSGSPVRVDGGLGIGVLTHGAAGLNFGTRLTHAIAISGVAGLQLSTVAYVHGV